MTVPMKMASSTMYARSKSSGFGLSVSSISPLSMQQIISHLEWSGDRPCVVTCFYMFFMGTDPDWVLIN